MPHHTSAPGCSLTCPAPASGRNGYGRNGYVGGAGHGHRLRFRFGHQTYRLRFAAYSEAFPVSGSVVAWWPGWEASNRVASHWTVSDYAHEDGQLLCEYARRRRENFKRTGCGRNINGALVVPIADVNGTPFITPMYDSQSIPLLSTGIGTAVSEPHPCCHSISLLLLLLASHSQLSAAACCLLLVVCLSAASIPPYSPSRRLGPLR